MPLSTPSSVARQIETLFEGGSVAGLTDRQLIERFNARRDDVSEIAFAALVSRHGPMVLDICLQLLGNPHDADDAFQAVFLVLARKARSIGDPELLANWLYGVALRTARNAHMQRARRRKKEEAAMTRHSRSDTSLLIDPSVSTPEQSVLAREQAEALYYEIDRLPGPFRLPVVLCYFEGLTLEEAAQRLRCPAGTVRSRLARAYDKLRRGLTRRGVALSTAAVASVLASRTASACVSSALCETTARAAMNFPARRAAVAAASASAVAMAHDVLRSMLFRKLKLTVLTLVFVGSIAKCASYVIRPLQALAHVREGEPPGNPARTKPRPSEFAQGQIAADKNAQPPAPGRMLVTGRVLDPAGKPVEGATIDLVARPRKVFVDASADEESFSALGNVPTDAGGRFQLDVPRTPSMGLLNHTGMFDYLAMAAAPGFGLGWAELNPDAAQPEADIQLRPERRIHLKLVDLNGLPAVGIEVRTQRIGRPTATGMWDGVDLWPEPPAALRAWPRPTTSDDQGKLVLNGIGENLTVGLSVRDLRYARQYPRIETNGRAELEGKEITLALEPAKIIEGRVLIAESGQPVPHAIVAVAASRNEIGGMVSLKYHADDRGRFTANPAPGNYFRMSAFAPEGQLYLAREVEFAWKKGAVKKAIDIELPRGVVIRGKVSEVKTGRPLGGASVQYIAVRNKGDVVSGWPASVASKDDGSYQIAVPPGSGHLLVFGPTPDFVLNEVGWRRLYQDQPGGERYYAHAIVSYEARTGDQPHEISASLRPGVIIKGRVEGPGGQIVMSASVITTLRIVPTSPRWRGGYQIPVREGRFELHGLAPEGSTRICIFDADRKWGSTVEISGKRAGQDLTIRLEPCGQARARVVDRDGKPAANYRVLFQFVATPGPPKFSRNKQHQAELTADAEVMGNVDRKHYWHGPTTDGEGRLILPALIPGAMYRIIDRSNQIEGKQVRKDFTVKPGETLDLGDIVIEKQQQ
jgi:RNA polymerase sigma factor (sigma-70 family)